MSSTEQQTEVDERIYQLQPNDKERGIQADELTFQLDDHIRTSNDGPCSAKTNQTTTSGDGIVPLSSECFVGESLEDVEQLMIRGLILRLLPRVISKWLKLIVIVVLVLGVGAYVSYALYYSFDEDVAILVLVVLSVVALTVRLVWRILADRLTNLWSATKSTRLAKHRMVISRSVYRSKCFL